ncbi:hypothetical protein RclHR1_04060003 [Rhizophagus clarus]|uniref:Uncharacterized protein n=1 Tax=Rhizophagus clarus TaxID=94130 RepID=A0A2Z6RS57_9GLOM|nr:hypothetical protein RclHR1_04060003 [Rhizophagus clarus]GES98326.1 hypothetical protein RCL_jg24706.t1 [Rhizophagus clarus]
MEEEETISDTSSRTLTLDTNQSIIKEKSKKPKEPKHQKICTDDTNDIAMMEKRNFSNDNSSNTPNQQPNKTQQKNLDDSIHAPSKKQNNTIIAPNNLHTGNTQNTSLVEKGKHPIDNTNQNTQMQENLDFSNFGGKKILHRFTP